MAITRQRFNARGLASRSSISTSAPTIQVSAMSQERSCHLIPPHIPTQIQTSAFYAISVMVNLHTSLSVGPFRDIQIQPPNQRQSLHHALSAPVTAVTAPASARDKRHMFCTHPLLWRLSVRTRSFVHHHLRVLIITKAMRRLQYP